jgi:hypothetical protein
MDLDSWPTLQSCAMGRGWELVRGRHYVTTHCYISRDISCHRVEKNLHLQVKEIKYCIVFWHPLVSQVISTFVRKVLPLSWGQRSMPNLEDISHWCSSSLYPHLHIPFTRSAYSFTLKMEATFPSKTSTKMYQTVQYHIVILYINHRENLT